MSIPGLPWNESAVQHIHKLRLINESIASRQITKLHRLLKVLRLHNCAHVNNNTFVEHPDNDKAVFIAGCQLLMFLIPRHNFHGT